MRKILWLFCGLMFMYDCCKISFMLILREQLSAFQFQQLSARIQYGHWIRASWIHYQTSLIGSDTVRNFPTCICREKLASVTFGVNKSAKERERIARRVQIVW